MRPLANPFMKFMLATMSLVVLAAPVRAQEIENPYAPKATERARTQPNSVSYARMHDARGLNVFETPKVEGVPYDGFKMQWGAAFTQQFQSLKHENSQTPIPVADTLIKIGSGFNNAEANLYMDAQLARGMRVALTSYLSSRHHNETWVKDGYLLIDGSPWENETLDEIMKYVTLRLGHMEINYGDMHFRRTDNGSAMFNPLVGNLLMDAFTTEVGGELYVRKDEYMGMVAVTGGEVRGQVLKPENRSPAVIAKVGYDKTFEPGTRFRITGSLYSTSKSNNNTLFSGNRSGSRYYYVLENKGATETAQAWSGDVRPGMTRKVQAWVINPFVTYKGLELFGNYEQAKGRTLTETADRKVTQWAAEGVYRFLNNNLYVAGRYNQVKGRVQDASGTPTAADVTVNRTQVGGGWFLTQTALAKLEYVKQEHRDYPLASRFAEGNFHGVMFEAVVSF